MCTRSSGAKLHGTTINTGMPVAKSAWVLISSNATDTDRSRLPCVTQEWSHLWQQRVEIQHWVRTDGRVVCRVLAVVQLLESRLSLRSAQLTGNGRDGTVACNRAKRNTRLLYRGHGLRTASISHGTCLHSSLCELECIAKLSIQHRRRSTIQAIPSVIRRTRLGLRTVRFGALTARRSRNLDNISASLSGEPCMM
jgi:hypothetical protein